MLRILRAFAWLRWRVLINSLERHGGRDVLERFSLAMEQLTPTIILVLMVPSALSLAAVSGYAGWLLAQGEPRVCTFDAMRFVLFAGCLFAIVGPIVLPAGDRTNAVRLLLLPISRGVLYLAQGMSALADPWVLLVAAVLVSLPIGLAAGGAPGAAAIAALAGILLIVLLAGLTLAVTSLVQLAVRDRRRGEIITLLFIVILPMIGILPAALDADRTAADGDRATSRAIGSLVVGRTHGQGGAPVRGLRRGGAPRRPLRGRRAERWRSSPLPRSPFTAWRSRCSTACSPRRSSADRRARERGGGSGCRSSRRARPRWHSPSSSSGCARRAAARRCCRRSRCLASSRC